MLVSDEMFESQDETHILHPSSRALFRFWEAMRAERPAPSRDELDLKRIRPLVPQLFIAEYAAKASVFRWRLAGTGICELHRRELTGTDMFSGWDSFEIDVMSRFLTATITTRQPAVLRVRLHTNTDQIIGAEIMAFPMMASDGFTTHIFGGVFPFRQPDLLDYASLTRFELSAARSVWTENLPVAPREIASAAPIRRNFHVISGGRP